MTAIKDQLPPSIIPVFLLRGSFYEMGYQYGYQAAQYIEQKKINCWKTAIQKFNTKENVLKEIQASIGYIEKWMPAFLDQIRGIANGSNAAGYQNSFSDILLINSELDFTTVGSFSANPHCSSDGVLTSDSCSLFSAWGEMSIDQKLICGDSIDSEFDYHVTLIAFPEAGHAYITTASAGKLASVPSMNAKGVFFGRAAGGAVRNQDYDYGIPFPYQTLYLSQFSENADQAKEKLLEMEPGGNSSRNFLVSDTGGRAYVIEQTAALKCVRQPGDFGERDFIYATNNYFCDEMRAAIKGEKFIEHAGWLGRGASISSIPRNLEMWHLFSQYNGRVDLDFAKMMWRLPGMPPPYPMDPKAYEDTQGEGWDQKICNLKNSRVGILQPRDGDGGVAYFCAGPAGRIAYPLKPGEGDYYQIAGTHSFYQVALANNPKAVVEAAKNEAHRTIAEAYQNLMTLNYTDPGYAIINEWYTKANEEYYQGEDAQNEGWLSEGDQGLCYLSQAVTFYTRSQAHAKQVCHSFVPPPSCPADLSLTT